MGLSDTHTLVHACLPIWFSHFLPCMQRLDAGFGILTQISLPYVLGSLRAKTVSILLFISSSKMDPELPVEYCGIYWLKGDILSHLNFLWSLVDVNTLCWDCQALWTVVLIKFRPSQGRKELGVGKLFSISACVLSPWQYSLLKRLHQQLLWRHTWH